MAGGGVNASYWTDERIETMRRLADEGKSATEIATAISGRDHTFTRNAILGMAFRLEPKVKLKAVPVDVEEHVREAVKKVKRAAPKTARPPAPLRPPRPARQHIAQATRSEEPLIFYTREPPPEPVLLMVCSLELQPDQCKWPVKHPRDPDFGFCGQPRYHPKTPYCEYHARRSRTAITIRERERA